MSRSLKITYVEFAPEDVAAFKAFYANAFDREFADCSIGR